MFSKLKFGDHRMKNIKQLRGGQISSHCREIWCVYDYNSKQILTTISGSGRDRWTQSGFKWQPN